MSISPVQGTTHTLPFASSILKDLYPGSLHLDDLFGVFPVKMISEGNRVLERQTF